jgi:putative efflux protein, MATE family
MQKFERNLTEGNVTKQLFSFSLPFLLSNFLQAMYNVTDTLVVGWFSGTNSISGVSNGGQITLLIINFAVGFTVGGAVLIGQYFGANKREELSKTIGTLLSLLAILAIILTLGVIIFSGPILRLIRIPEEAFLEAQRYLVICSAGTIFIFGYNAVAAILRGMGDSKNPLFFVLISGIINIFLDILFVGPFQWGAMGAAAATVIAQAVSLILSIIYLNKKGFIFEFKLQNFKIDISKLKLLCKIGLPSSVQSLVVGFSFLLMMILVNDFGVEASAAMGIVGKFSGFAILPGLAMSSSISSMVAQNLGAGKIDRAIKTMHSGFFLAAPIGAIFSLLAFFVPDLLIRIFTTDSAVIDKGVEYIRFYGADYVLACISFCILGLLIGAGQTTFTMCNSIFSSLILRIPLAYFFGITLGIGLAGIGLAAPAATIGHMIVSFIYYKTGRWKRYTLI